jgi:hypothetical protein
MRNDVQSIFRARGVYNINYPAWRPGLTISKKE